MAEAPETYERYIDVRLKITVETETYTLGDEGYEESYVADIKPEIIGSNLYSLLAIDLATTMTDTDRYQEMLVIDIPSAIGDYFHEYWRLFS